MRYLLDKSVVRRCVRGLIGGRLTDEIRYSVKYTKRWARRLRDMGFGREDAYLLSLATYGTDQREQGRILGVHVLVTYDYRLQNHFETIHSQLETRLRRMTVQLSPPYSAARLPDVNRPDQVISRT